MYPALKTDSLPLSHQGSPDGLYLIGSKYLFAYILYNHNNMLSDNFNIYIYINIQGNKIITHSSFHFNVIYKEIFKNLKCE